MRRIFITGATSFIGINLINDLVLDKENKLLLILRENSKNNQTLDFVDAKKVEINLENFEETSSLIEDECDVFFHFAWNGTRGNDRNNEKLQKSNYLNSIQVLNAAYKLKAKVFVFAGSQAEYGVCNGLITEETNCNPNTEYGKYKLKFSNYAEKFCKNNNITYIEPRFFSIYGEEDKKETLIMSAIEKFLSNDEVCLNNGSQNWNYLYIKDAIKGLILLVNKNKSGIYNFASKDTRYLKDYMNQMKEILNSKSEIKDLNLESSSVNLNPSIEKLCKTTNWEPEISFDEGIRKILKLERR